MKLEKSRWLNWIEKSQQKKKKEENEIKINLVGKKIETKRWNPRVSSTMNLKLKGKAHKKKAATK